MLVHLWTENCESSSFFNQCALVLQEKSYELPWQITAFLQAIIFLPKNLALWTDVSLLFLTTYLFGREMKKKSQSKPKKELGLNCFSLHQHNSKGTGKCYLLTIGKGQSCFTFSLSSCAQERKSVSCKPNLLILLRDVVGG